VFGWFRRIFRRDGGDTGSEGESDLVLTIFSRLDALESDMVDVKKKAEATRRKVYREEDKGPPGGDGEQPPQPQDVLANLRSGDEVPPGMLL